MRKVMIVVTICLALVGCTSKKQLSREEAFQLLNQELGYPKVYSYDLFCADSDQARKVLDAGLETNGFLTVKRTQKMSEMGQRLIELTNKATPYLLASSQAEKKISVQKVKIADQQLIEVTGVTTSDDGKRAEASYVVGYKNITPFAALISIDLRKPSSRTAQFILYDDGWKLERKN